MQHQINTQWEDYLTQKGVRGGTEEVREVRMRGGRKEGAKQGEREGQKAEGKRKLWENERKKERRLESK